MIGTATGGRSYAIYPIGRCLTKLTTAQILTVMSLMIVASALLIPSLHISFSRDLPFPVFYTIPPYRVAEFLVGCGIATLFLRHGTNSIWLIPGLAIVPILGFFGESNSRYMMFNGILIPLIACLIFGLASAGFSKTKIVSVIVANPVSRYLGETSYSFFLMQLPLMLFADQHKEIFSELTTTQLLLLFVSANQAAASFSYHFVERPGQRYLLRRFRNNATHTQSAIHSSMPNTTAP
jgi:peptidoglycan/LPS O-acetylase OafA/YrhL